MASCVRHVNASLSSATNVTVTGDWCLGIWVKINSGGYSPAGDTAICSFGTTGGSSEGVLIGVGAGLTALFAGVFRAGASEFQTVNALTGSNTAWVFISIQHVSGSASYTVRWRLENVTTFSSTTLTLTTQIANGGSIYIGTDQFVEPQPDADSRHFFIQATTMSDATLLTASQNIDTAPSGTNLHWLRLLDAASATTNGGTAGNWTSSGTLQSASTQPTESSGSTISVDAGTDTPSISDYAQWDQYFTADSVALTDTVSAVVFVPRIINVVIPGYLSLPFAN